MRDKKKNKKKFSHSGINHKKKSTILKAKDSNKGPSLRPVFGPKESVKEKELESTFQSVQKATVDKNWKGFAFLVFENKSFEDAYVAPERAKSLFHGDRVEVRLNRAKFPVMISVLGHRFKTMVGRYSSTRPLEGEESLPSAPVSSSLKLRSTTHSKASQSRSGGGWLIYERKKAYEVVYLPASPRLKELKEGDWLKIELTFHEEGSDLVTGEILEIYGDSIPASADIDMVAGEFGLTEHHSAQAEAEAKKFTFQIPEGRVDLRKIPFITIDGETARDFDDAVYVEKQNSHYRLWVAIADVSHYVQVGTHLDREARERGTSVYFPERAFHMLPSGLSENLCSIRPLEPRLTLVAKMEFDSEGNRTGIELMEAVIESKRRATYEEIQAESEKNQKNSRWEFAQHFELYQILKKSRERRGTIDFDLPEAEVRLEPNGEVLSIKKRTRVDSHRLIEEFMIAANEAVTVWMLGKNWPFVYRVHEEPSLASLAKFQLLAHSMGIPFSVKEAITSKKIADLISELEGHPAQALLNMAALRSMKQAVYSSVHQGHFGLASTAYTHFTSPIRRYPDLVVHRLIRMVLRNSTFRGTDRDALEKELAQICEHCSYHERLAADAEREAIKLKQVRVMSKHLGEDFDASVVGMVASGIFVQLEDPYVEGLISVASLSDDRYEWLESRMILRGQASGRSFKIGDQFRVKTVKVDLDKRQIEFVLLETQLEPHAKTSQLPRVKRKSNRNSV